MRAVTFTLLLTFSFYTSAIVQWNVCKLNGENTVTYSAYDIVNGNLLGSTNASVVGNPSGNVFSNAINVKTKTLAYGFNINSACYIHVLNYDDSGVPSLANTCYISDRCYGITFVGSELYVINSNSVLFGGYLEHVNFTADTCSITRVPGGRNPVVLSGGLSGPGGRLVGLVATNSVYFFDESSSSTMYSRDVTTGNITKYENVRGADGSFFHVHAYEDDLVAYVVISDSGSVLFNAISGDQTDFTSSGRMITVDPAKFDYLVRNTYYDRNHQVLGESQWDRSDTCAGTTFSGTSGDPLDASIGLQFGSAATSADVPAVGTSAATAVVPSATAAGTSANAGSNTVSSVDESDIVYTIDITGGLDLLTTIILVVVGIVVFVVILIVVICVCACSRRDNMSYQRYGIS